MKRSISVSVSDSVVSADGAFGVKHKKISLGQKL